MAHHLLIYRIDIFYEPKRYIYHFESLKTDQKCLKNAKNAQIYGLNHCTSTPPWNFIKKSIYLIYLPARVCEKVKNCIQKRKDLCLVLNWSTSAYATGVTNLGTHWKWIFNDLWHFFENFVVLTTADMLTYNVEAAGEEMGTTYLIT